MTPLSHSALEEAKFIKQQQKQQQNSQQRNVNNILHNTTPTCSDSSNTVMIGDEEDVMTSMKVQHIDHDNDKMERETKRLREEQLQFEEDPGLVLYKFSKRNETKYNHLFHRERVLVGLVGDAAVLMTFGTIFPPMAVVICITIGINSVIIQLMIGRFVSLSYYDTQRYLRPLVSFINNECKDIGKLLSVVLPTISILASSFWAFALFDCLGDKVGIHRALWIVIGVGSMPSWGYFVLLGLKNVIDIERVRDKIMTVCLSSNSSMFSVLFNNNNDNDRDILMMNRMIVSSSDSSSSGYSDSRDNNRDVVVVIDNNINQHGVELKSINNNLNDNHHND